LGLPPEAGVAKEEILWSRGYDFPLKTDDEAIPSANSLT